MLILTNNNKYNNNTNVTQHRSAVLQCAVSRHDINMCPIKKIGTSSYLEGLGCPFGHTMPNHNEKTHGVLFLPMTLSHT